MACFMLYGQPMRSFLQERGPLLLIATAAGWGGVAFGFGLLAEARWQSVLWASFERLFLSLAVVSAALAVVLIIRRSTPGDSTWLRHFRRYALGPASSIAAAYWIATSFVDMRIGVLALGASLGFLVQLDRRLPPGGGGVHVHPLLPPGAEDHEQLGPIIGSNVYGIVSAEYGDGELGGRTGLVVLAQADMRMVREAGVGGAVAPNA